MTEKQYIFILGYWLVGYISSLIYFGVKWEDFSEFLEGTISKEIIDKYMKPYIVLWLFPFSVVIFPVVLNIARISIIIKYKQWKRHRHIKKRLKQEIKKNGGFFFMPDEETLNKINENNS